MVETLVDYCKLCTTDYNSQNCKFYSVVELIRRNKLYGFSAIKEVQKARLVAARRAAMEVQNASNEAELASSQLIVSSNEFISTEAVQQKGRKERLIVNKTFAALGTRQGGERVKVEGRTRVDGPSRSSYEQPRQMSFVGSGVVVKPNYVEVRKKQFTGSLIEGRSAVQMLPQRVSPPLFTIKEAVEKPGHYAQL